MMDKWVAALKQIAAILFDRGSSAETLILSVVLLASVILIFKFTAPVLTGSIGQVLFVLVPGLLLMIAAAVAVRAFYREGPVYELCGAALVLLVLIVPLTRTMQGSAYLGAFLLWFVVLLTVAAVFYVESTISRAVDDGIGMGSSMKRQNNRMDDFLKKSNN
jgi:hypothetical protein